MDMYLVDRQERVILLANVASVVAGRALWCAIAGRFAESNLSEFIIMDGGTRAYRGDYITDEC
jgi:hypothetical protein